MDLARIEYSSFCNLTPLNYLKKYNAKAVKKHQVCEVLQPLLK